MYFGSTGKAIKSTPAGTPKLLPTKAGKFKFAFDANGYMVYGYTDNSFESVDNVWDATYYFGDHEDGALKTNYWVEYTDGDAPLLMRKSLYGTSSSQTVSELMLKVQQSTMERPITSILPVL